MAARAEALRDTMQNKRKQEAGKTNARKGDRHEGREEGSVSHVTIVGPRRFGTHVMKSECRSRRVGERTLLRDIHHTADERMLACRRGRKGSSRRSRRVR